MVFKRSPGASTSATINPPKNGPKNRKGPTLDFEDIMHYQRILKVLTETERVMKEIDGVGI